MAKKLLYIDFLFLLVFLICTPSAYANGNLERRIDEVMGPSIAGSVPGKYLQVHNFVVGTSTLSDISKATGIPARSTNENGTRISYICGRTSKHDAVVYFESGAMGSWSTVTSAVFAEIDYFPERICEETISADLNAEWIKIGMDKALLLEMLGNIVTYASENRIEASFMQSRKFIDRDDQYLKGVNDSGIIVELNNREQVSAFAIYYLDSY